MERLGKGRDGGGERICSWAVLEGGAGGESSMVLIPYYSLSMLSVAPASSLLINQKFYSRSRSLESDTVDVAVACGRIVCLNPARASSCGIDVSKSDS